MTTKLYTQLSWLGVLCFWIIGIVFFVFHVQAFNPLYKHIPADADVVIYNACKDADIRNIAYTLFKASEESQQGLEEGMRDKNDCILVIEKITNTPYFAFLDGDGEWFAIDDEMKQYLGQTSEESITSKGQLRSFLRYSLRFEDAFLHFVKGSFIKTEEAGKQFNVGHVNINDSLVFDIEFDSEEQFIFEDDLYIDDSVLFAGRMRDMTQLKYFYTHIDEMAYIESVIKNVEDGSLVISKLDDNRQGYKLRISKNDSVGFEKIFDLIKHGLAQEYPATISKKLADGTYVNEYVIDSSRVVFNEINAEEYSKILEWDLNSDEVSVFIAEDEHSLYISNDSDLLNNSTVPDTQLPCDADFDNKRPFMYISHFSENALFVYEQKNAIKGCLLR